MDGKCYEYHWFIILFKNQLTRLNILKKTLELYKETNDYEGVSKTYNNIASIFKET